jgi:hypothetical protein
MVERLLSRTVMAEDHSLFQSSRMKSNETTETLKNGEKGIEILIS